MEDGSGTLVSNKLNVEPKLDAKINQRGLHSSGLPTKEPNICSISQLQGEYKSKAVGGSATVSRKAFGVQDKLWSIYAAGKTVPIPFLKAIDIYISFRALVSDNVVGNGAPETSFNAALEAVKKLFSSDHGQAKKGRRGQKEVPLPYHVEKLLVSVKIGIDVQQMGSIKCELRRPQRQSKGQNPKDTLSPITRT